MSSTVEESVEDRMRDASEPGSDAVEQLDVDGACEAVARLYHAFFTGLVLMLTTRRGTRDAAELVFRLFRRKQQEQFLPGLEKLGLRGLPDAVAAAQYHYLSNQLGGVKVEYMEETERKAWIRYPPPRWAWQGVAIAGIPSEVSAAMLRGWHAHNGVSLHNPRLGFVCTKQTVDSQPGLEGYYYEHDRALEPAERLRFVRGEEAPPFDPVRAPRVPAADWPAQRLRKAYRNYAMDYARTGLTETIELFGPAEGGHLAAHTAALVAMQLCDELEALVQVEGDGAEGFARFFVALAEAQGDDACYRLLGDTVVIEQSTWRFARGLGPLHRSVFEAWNELWRGALAAHDRFLTWEPTRRLDLGDEIFAWQVGRRRYRGQAQGGGV